MSHVTDYVAYMLSTIIPCWAMRSLWTFEMWTSDKGQIPCLDRIMWFRVSFSRVTFHNKRQCWRSTQSTHERNYTVGLCNKHMYNSSFVFWTTLLSFKVSCFKQWIFFRYPQIFGWRDIAFRIWCWSCKFNQSKGSKTLCGRYILWHLSPIPV